MSDEDVEAAALSDTDALPISDSEFEHRKRVPRVKTIRRALALTQDEFAQRFHIPVGTLRDWEQGRSTPDQPALAYLKVIARDPEAVARALKAAE